MNEQRQQAYFNLIQSLLNCRSHNQVQEILAANQELVDLGFLQSVEAAAAMFSLQGYENTANWLQGLGMQLKGWLNRDTEVDLQSLSEEEVQAYLQLLMELLQATAKSWGNAQVVYPLLANNLDKLDGVLAEILRQWGTNTLRETKAERAKDLAAVIVLFSTLIGRFSFGNKANNVEIDITGCEVALTVYTQQAFPYEWAGTQNNLGIAYLYRIKGERAENLELAIAYYQQALKVYSLEAFPYEWAQTQINLGAAYSNRIKGERAENLELAITCLQEALKIYTLEAFSQDWAMTQNNLGEAYRNRIRGERAENLELALTAYHEALKVLTVDAFPYEWAMTQNNLGIAYLYRIRGERAENLELAIACLQEALKVCTLEAFPQDWARTQNNLALAYSERIRGERAENLELALTAYHEALKIYTFEAFPQDWAMTQNNLALAYVKRIKGEQAENLELALTAYHEALKVLIVDAFPYEWAGTQNNLGEAYIKRIREERAENLELALTAYRKALEIYALEAFPYEWARTQNNLALAYSERIRGERAENLELALTAYHEALKIYTFEAFPQDWAMTQNNLGISYLHRIRGERAENLELAVAFFQQALKVYIFEAFPYEWATTQNNLANTYVKRIRGERAENLELALTAYHEALKITTFEAFPQDWAQTQNNLAAAYSDRIRGKRAENLELAIAYYQQALKVYTLDAFPQDWTRTQNNLAAAYSQRIRGDRAENLELALTAYHEALKIYTFEAFPQDWAMTQNNLGEAYRNRIRGKRAENLELALTAYYEALKIYTFEAFPYEWAGTQNNLAAAYSQRIKGEQAENLELAITCFQQALKITTFEAFPYEWAQTQSNLGAVYSDRIRGEGAENLELAIACCQAALKVYTLEAFPYEWAGTQNNLINAYLNRITGDRTQNLELAIACCQAVLEVYTLEAFPQNHAETLFKLGIAYQKTNQFTLAYKNFEFAIATVESLRSEIVSGEESKRKQAEHFNRIYSYMVEVCLTLGNITTAIEYVERSKNRNLVEQILERDSKTIFPLEVVTRLEKYRDEIATGQYQIQNGKAENLEVLAQYLQELRQERNELQNRYLAVGYGFKFDSLKATLDERTAIIEWYILDEKILAFIVTQKGEITVWQSQLKDQQALTDLATQYLRNYYKIKELWQNSLGVEIKKLASILHIDEIFDQIPKHCDRLILIPHRFLHIFPLHVLPVASQNSENSPCLLDLFANGVSYAPSCQILRQVQQRKRPDFQSLFAIQNPTEDLDYADLEVDGILNFFSSHQVLSYKQATKATLLQQIPQLKEANYLHFACHGSFNFKSPQDSCLLLAESVDEKKYLDLSKCLTLGNLFEREFRLDNCRLVILSACETGLIDFTNISDEYIGLPSGFLYAGSTSVVSSLWAVNDLSTAFLMIKFSHNLQAAMTDSGDFSIAVELQKAQLWLRDVTTEELQTWVSQLKLSPKQAQKICDYLDLFDSDEKLFQNPVYWAAFCATGQ
jgi:CHAT domain-containing protein